MKRAVRRATRLHSVRLLFAVASLFANVGTNAFASPPIAGPNYPGERLNHGRIDSTFSADGALRYYSEGLAAENIIALFTCDEIRFWVPTSYAGTWLLRPNESQYWPTATIRFDDFRTPPFLLVELEMGELTGGWVARIDWPAEPVDWMTPFASATNVTIETPAFEIVLSPAEGDPEARAAFVEACLAM